MDKRSALRIQRHVPIPLSDGAVLSADLYLPEAAPPCGAVVEYLPYRKDDLTTLTEWRHKSLAARGFAAVKLDIRGTGASTGLCADEYLSQEQTDATEALTWLASQDWCNGNVGLWGYSYGGFNALQIAAARPPSLKAVVAAHFTDDRYTDDVHYGGGSLRAWDQLNYGLKMVAMTGLPPARPDGQEAVEADWFRGWTERMESDPWALRWLREQVDGPYWRHGSISTDYSAIECATYLIGGWRDGYRNAVLRTFEQLACPKRVVIGPWAHNWPDVGNPGPHIDVVGEIARWFGHWLNGWETGITDEAPVALFVQSSTPPDPAPRTLPGRWIRCERVPRSLNTRTFLLGPGGDLITRLTHESTRLAVPNAPWAGSCAGVWCPGEIPRIHPLDQRAEEAGSLVFTSLPLAEPLQMFGNVKVKLHVQSGESVAQIAVRLCDLAPSGASTLVTRASLNLTRRDSWSHPTPLEPGAMYPISLELDATTWRFDAGHRLRLLVASADWPNLWPTPRLPNLSVRFDHTRPASITLPILDYEDTGHAFPTPSDLADVPSTVSLPEWSLTYNALDDLYVVRTGSKVAYETRDGAVRVSSDHAGMTSVKGRKPADASATGHVVYSVRYPNTSVEATGRTQLTSEATTFRLTISLDVSIDANRVFAKVWRESVPRELM